MTSPDTPPGGKNNPIVIVGGGIAGAALASALAAPLAPAGRPVVVLESTPAFHDRVRGESMMPWGVAEAQALGIADLLRAAGAHTARLWKRYVEGDAVARDLPVGRLVAGVEGTLNLHHPVACQALLDAAAAAGARVIRGVHNVVVLPGLEPTVTYRLNDQEHTGPGSALAFALADARPIGPCGAIPGTDTWTDRPCVDGLVLVGDAAGHNDPSVGCGLSIAMRDARLVRDLVVRGARSADDFAPYGTERLERMRRLRLIADFVAAATVEAGPNRPARRQHFAHAMATRDAQIFPLVMGMFAGPETIPPHLVNDSVLDRIRSV